MRQKLALEPLNVEDYTSHVFRLYWQIVYPLPEEKNNPKANKQTKERKKKKKKAEIAIPSKSVLTFFYDCV